VIEVLVALGHHRSTSVPAAAAHDVNGGGEEGVGAAYDGADVGVAGPVLDGDMKRVPSGIEVLDDGLDSPVAETIDYVAAISFGQELGIEAWIVRPGGGVGSDPGPWAVGVFVAHGGALELFAHDGLVSPATSRGRSQRRVGDGMGPTLTIRSIRGNRCGLSSVHASAMVGPTPYEEHHRAIAVVDTPLAVARQPRLRQHGGAQSTRGSEIGCQGHTSGS